MDQFTSKDRERLVRVEDQIENLCKAVDKFIQQAESDKGFSRCSARAVKWEEMEKYQKRFDGFVTWFYRSIVGAVLAGLATLILSHLGFLESLIRGLTGEGP